MDKVDQKREQEKKHRLFIGKEEYTSEQSLEVLNFLECAEQQIRKEVLEEVLSGLSSSYDSFAKEKGTSYELKKFVNLFEETLRQELAKSEKGEK